MRFVIKTSSTLGPYALFRVISNDDGLDIRYDRFDNETIQWVVDPRAIAITGIGGATEYDDVSSSEARRWMRSRGYDPDLLRADVPRAALPSCGVDTGAANRAAMKATVTPTPTRPMPSPGRR